ncbi:MAG: hypothetical protein A2231_01875 [Candidatus Firestonebacteria bacterium RIFOXYA2_FULL_40_8]|nr:MAG: hypothetical protein A2231_01875 [Candidatus Firestonebacteria bacterium RIFOXYA2_FULL_40_8]
MNNFISDYPVISLTKGEGQYFFGYYDIKAWDASNRYMLAHKVKFCDRIQEADDEAVIGMIDFQDNYKFIELTSTKAWNFQQGAMLQWLGGQDTSKIIYNDRVDNKYTSVIFDVKTKKKKVLPLPVATVTSDGKKALSINFSRMFTFRPGYGYAGIEDPYFDVLHPKDNGIFLLDLETGEKKLILSLFDIKELHINEDLETKKILVNHITFNPDGSRFLFLPRYTHTKPDGSKWNTALFTADLNGKNTRLLIDYGVVSHYYWTSPTQVLAYARIKDKGREIFLLDDRTGKAEIVNKEVFNQDAHMSTSPDGKWILGDTYKDEKGFQTLRLYNIKEKREVILGRFFSPELFTGDIRCDLHPRWNRTGTMVSFDATFENKRGIYAIDVRSIVG